MIDVLRLVDCRSHPHHLVEDSEQSGRQVDSTGLVSMMLNFRHFPILAQGFVE